MAEIRTTVWAAPHEMGQTYSISEHEAEPTLYGPNEKPIVKARYPMGFRR